MCHEFLEPSRSRYCNYTAHEKGEKGGKIFGNADVSSEKSLQRCTHCNVTSFSFVWRFFHEKICYFHTHTTSVEGHKSARMQ